jgi:DNA (cytosine-5)-methyltransferase 1
MITYGSLCTGIASETLVWRMLGWKTLWFAEKDPVAKVFLREKYPDVPNLGDLHGIDTEAIRGTGAITNPTLIVGGTPCQSFSVNGLRKGITDKRGIVTLRFLEIVAELQPQWVVWENVTNVLRVDGGKVFRYILNQLEECGYGWAYRVCNLRGFGVPQRRKRVFVVGYLGGNRPPCAVLFNELFSTENTGSLNQKQKESLERIRELKGVKSELDGWAGDETPKRCEKGIPTLRRDQGGEGVGWIYDGGLRNLTIHEMEKLQGFPPDYIKFTYKGRDASYTLRRQLLGNSFSPPILYWMGRRINFVHSQIEKLKTKPRDTNGGNNTNG